MKLIIDISEADYDRLKDGRLAVSTMRKILLDGTPLEDIKTEIKGIELNGQIDEHTMFTRTADQVKTMVLEIIDKHIRERSEDE